MKNTDTLYLDKLTMTTYGCDENGNLDLNVKPTDFYTGDYEKDSEDNLYVVFKLKK